MRNFYRKIKNAQKLCISSIIDSGKDGRLYAEVSFLEKVELGLLDTGANISCIGARLATEDFSHFPGFKRIKSIVRTADGQSHDVVGIVSVEMQYKKKLENINLYIVPNLNHSLILGLDFWRLFGLIDNIISGVTLDDAEVDEDEYPLTSLQKQQLNLVKTLFPNF